MGILAQPARPDDPAGTCTRTRKYPYPEHGYGYFQGTGTGSPGMTPGLPVRQPKCKRVFGQRYARLLLISLEGRLEKCMEARES